MTTIVDIHPHIISSNEHAYPRNPLNGVPSVWSKNRPTSWQQLIQSMDEAHVGKAAIVQASTCYGFDNSYVADAVQARPDRFTGVFSIDLMAQNAPETMRYWVERGLTGVRVFTAGSTMPTQANTLDDPRTYPAWQAAQDLNIPFCVQMLPQGLGMLETMLKKFTKIKVIVDHFMSVPIAEGPPYTQSEPLFSLAQNPNVYLKLSIITVRECSKGLATPESFLGRVVKAFGSGRIAWGSNFPASDGTLLEMVQESQKALSFLEPKDRDNILSKTALSLYPALN
ncbi:MAG: amidohydrolase [Betaproteobacteria bacterium]|nr:amidohydrolase [Betaproteobacteria bacterium]